MSKDSTDVKEKGTVSVMSIEKINAVNQIYKAATGNSTQNSVTKEPNVQKSVQTVNDKSVNKTETPVKKEKKLQETTGDSIDKQNEEMKEVKNVIAEVNKKMNAKTRCEFSYHEETKRISIKVYDEATNQVIREIPPEETLDMLAKMWDIAGILIDEHR